ncbi:hypothetical protein GGU10DRAFT_341858 [Lentinula aff. detonsa]|uniref:Uncharacterized protein n=1 Tax=Lentinula aff. detonsa TaxID=2804958 RepID=A0AA38U6D2_9AGAR|nr:hypothetical protein GGU10DRAFT_341858 [Lentinula aff. detonsa]
MSNVGNKVKGAFNTVHGIGENSIRATALGAVDTIAHDKEGEVKNDQIAQQGRMETQRGMEQMSGRQQNTNTMANNYNTTTADPALANSTIANTTANPSTSDYPRHHRDNEVYNDSQAQTVYDHGNNVPSQAGYTNAVGGVPEPSGNTEYGAGYGAGYGVGNNNVVDPRQDVGNSQYDNGNRRY